jgi:class 3 adenylate cyclase
VGAYLDAASAAITDMGGKVAKKLGDGLMALFGYPPSGLSFAQPPSS